MFSQTYEGAIHAVTNQCETKPHIETIKTKKNLPGTVLKNIACKKKKKWGKNRNDVKRKLK